MTQATPKRDPVLTFIEKLADFSSTPTAIVCAVASVIFWSAVGPLFHFSSGWQLTINSVANIGTFLMVFLIQTTQAHARKSLESKLDQLIQKASAQPLTSQDIDMIINAQSELGSFKEYLKMMSPFQQLQQSVH